MRHTRLLMASLALLFSLLLSARLQAAPIDDAKKAFAEGKSAFERGDYETALAAYQNANRILPAPNLYYNIGATYEKLGRYQEAALAFDEYFKTAGAPGSDDERDFQDKLHARAEADRKRANTVTPPPRVESQPLPQVGSQPPPPRAQQAPPPNYYAPNPYYAAPYGNYPMQLPREDRLRQAKARRVRAIVLMAIGVPMSVVGITLLAYSPAFYPNDLGSFYGDIFAGMTLTVVGITLWAPGAGSYVRSSRDIRELSAPAPFNGAH